MPNGVRFHRARPIVPAIGGIESVPDMLEHVAMCLPELEALIVWESALRTRIIGIRELHRIRWTSRAARRLAAMASDKSDSLLETIVLHGLRGLGLRVEQQVALLGHRVDFLVEGRLIVQTDGFGVHTGRQRQLDIEHDARLMLEGRTVLRFAYPDVIGRWPHVVEMILRHLALGTAAIA